MIMSTIKQRSFMKKIFTLLLLVMLTITGCVMIENDFPNIMNDEDISLYQNYENFRFKSLNGNEDLEVSRTFNDDNTISIETSKSKNKYLAVAVYKKDCEVCKIQASWLNKLAKEVPSALYGMDYIIIFTDIFEDTYNKDVEWMRDLSNVEAYTNIATACSGGACQNVFTPHIGEPFVGGLYLLKKDNIIRHNIIKWDTTTDPQEQYDATVLKIADFLGLKEINFDASVRPWENTDVGI